MSRTTEHTNDDENPQIRTPKEWDEKERAYAAEVAASPLTDPNAIAPAMLGLLRLACGDSRAWHNPGQIAQDHSASSAQPALEALVVAKLAERAIYNGSYTNIVYRLAAGIDPGEHDPSPVDSDANENERAADLALRALEVFAGEIVFLEGSASFAHALERLLRALRLLAYRHDVAYDAIDMGAQIASGADWRRGAVKRHPIETAWSEPRRLRIGEVIVGDRVDLRDDPAREHDADDGDAQYAIVTGVEPEEGGVVQIHFKEAPSTVFPAALRVRVLR